MMLDPTAEQREFQNEVRRYLERAWPLTLTRRSVDDPSLSFDAAAWKGLADMSAVGLLVPEEHGGAGASLVEAALVCEELGRRVVAAPYLSTAVLAPTLLVGLGDATHLPGIAAGTTIATVAFLDGKGRWSPSEISVSATDDRLTGRVPYVTDLGVADLLLVVATTPHGPAVFALPADAPGITRTALDCLDRTQPISALTLDGAAGTRIATTENVEAVLETVAAAGAACLATSQVGGAEECLDLATTYAGQRIQFGRVIGSYQAIKHKLADVVARVESARSAAYHLVDAVVTDSADLPLALGLAGASCSDAYVRTAGDCVQIHGGIGFTWEHAAHLYLKRARASAHLFGDPVHHRERLAAALLPA